MDGEVRSLVSWTRSGVGRCGVVGAGLDPEQREFHPPDGGMGGGWRASGPAGRTCGRRDERLVAAECDAIRSIQRCSRMLERAGIDLETGGIARTTRRRRRSNSRASPSRWMPTPTCTRGAARTETRSVRLRRSAATDGSRCSPTGGFSATAGSAKRIMPALLDALIDATEYEGSSRFHARFRAFAVGVVEASTCGRCC